MTYKEKFDNESDWKQKILIIELFHLHMLYKREKWTEKKTAKYFNKSIALISENLMLAKAIRNEELEGCTSRVKALKIVRSIK